MNALQKIINQNPSLCFQFIENKHAILSVITNKYITIWEDKDPLKFGIISNKKSNGDEIVKLNYTINEINAELINLTFNN